MADNGKPSPIAAAQAARASKPAGPREEVLSKDDFVESFRENLKTILGFEVSKAKAWSIFKVAMNTAFTLATRKALSLSGIGRFSLLDSQRSVDLGKPSKRMRFKASARVTKILNEGGSFTDDLGIAEEEEGGKKPAKAAKAAAGATAGTPAPAAQPAVATAAPGNDLI